MTDQPNKPVVDDRLQELDDILPILDKGFGRDGSFTRDEAIAALQVREQEAERRGRIKQSRRILQHEKDVWGASRNESYLRAEIRRLQHFTHPKKENHE